ncbi:MAG: hypothetical protein EOO06_18445 [Chitinophagaceae bacterium]|nr:MAG: hypothetical protein EOO06_18445 [Chitinophagaceae bacterium]
MWYRLVEWFSDVRERHNLLRDFNKAAKVSFINGQAPTLLEVRTSIGSMEYRHAFSKFMAGGFRIKALSGKALQKSELVEIGKVVLDNEVLVRKLVTLGWDTLEVHDVKGFQGCKWPLKDYAKIGGFLQ